MSDNNDNLDIVLGIKFDDTENKRRIKSEIEKINNRKENISVGIDLDQSSITKKLNDMSKNMKKYMIYLLGYS